MADFVLEIITISYCLVIFKIAFKMRLGKYFVKLVDGLFFKCYNTPRFTEIMEGKLNEKVINSNACILNACWLFNY